MVQADADVSTTVTTVPESTLPESEAPQETAPPVDGPAAPDFTVTLDDGTEFEATDCVRVVGGSGRGDSAAALSNPRTRKSTSR